MNSVLVTGGTGFVGSHLVRRLIKEGNSVHIFARPASSLWRIEDVLTDVTVWRGDLSDCRSIQQCLAGARPEIIFHLAGVTDVRWLDRNLSQLDESIDVNLRGTLNLLKEAQRGRFPVQSFIRAGGLEEYGHGQPPYNEDQRERPVSPYSASQVAATHYCQMLGPHLSFPVVTLRPALIYGPAQSSRFLIPSLITHCLRGQDFEMTSGDQGRDLLYVDDAIEAFTRVPAAELGGEVINIGTGTEYRMRDVADTIVGLTGAKISLKMGTAKERSSEVQHLFCQNQKAEQLLNWSPKTTLEEGLRQTIDWYRQHDPGQTELTLHNMLSDECHANYE